ncbi:long-chain fatty acid--CoA ligase [Nocardia sp. NBC_00508]|uniref:AMP-binding protein n=1 Tax=Nocardia sp. NBC_00508 TaxID=2975992 RepID=UPI002E80BC74|nr:AMP-binding protein [Nocardia sp. NBC_00508]WUD66641.1 long-chain fatty acid--CoA ligase [Nocardia sp. NBC_00508]
MTLSTLPDRRAEAAPHAPALADDSNELNNRELLATVQRAAARLRAAGVTTGDVVAIMLPATVDLVVSLFATWRLGATAALIDASLTDGEAGYQIADTGAKVLIVAAHPPAISPPVRVVTPACGFSAAAPDTTDAAWAGKEEPALVTYIGAGNRAMLDHGNLEAMCQLVIKVFALTGADHSLSTLPMSQVSGIMVGALSPLLAGGRATMAGPLSPEGFSDRIEHRRPTYLSAVPGNFAALSDLPGHLRTNNSSVRFAICCMEHAGTELKTKFEHRYGIPLVNGYGLSKVIARAHEIRRPAMP